MTEPEIKPKAKIEVPDITLIMGLVLLFLGLGFAVSWAISLAVTGAVLIGISIWLVEPKKTGEGK